MLKAVRHRMTFQMRIVSPVTGSSAIPYHGAKYLDRKSYPAGSSEEPEEDKETSSLTGRPELLSRTKLFGSGYLSW